MMLPVEDDAEVEIDIWEGNEPAIQLMGELPSPGKELINEYKQT